MNNKLDTDDLRFLKTTANEINGLLTELSGYLNVLENVLHQSNDDARLIPMMTDTLDRASALAGSIQKHIYSKEGHQEALGFLQPTKPSATSPTQPAPQVSASQPVKKAGPARIHPVKKVTLSDEYHTSASNPPETPVSSPVNVRNFGVLDSQTEAPVSGSMIERGKFEGAGHSMPTSRNIDSSLLGDQETILVVDDEKNILLLVEMMLRSANYKMLKAQDGEEALALFADRAEEIDLVILDFSMVGMDGQELFERMIELKPDTRILISSGYAEADALKDMLAKGLKGYIPKPYSRDRLLFQIKTAISEQ